MTIDPAIRILRLSAAMAARGWSCLAGEMFNQNSFSLAPGRIIARSSRGGCAFSVGGRHYRPCRFLGSLSVILLTLFGAGCESRPQVIKLHGATMGTHYNVTIVAVRPRSSTDIQREITATLAEINATMSTYNSGSELVRLNRNLSTKWIDVSKSLYIVLRAARDIGEMSEGAFDVTVGSLVNLWGFGAESAAKNVPTDSDIADARREIGLGSYALRADPRAFRKTSPAVNLDLSGIAKGYAVDELARGLERRGISRYLIDIGGELRASGRNPAGQVWRIGIENPLVDGRELGLVAELDSQSMATSGNYRNYFEQNGVRYGHTIDPTRAAPTQHRLLSVTVIHPSAMAADAWATALMSLGEVSGPAVANRESLAALFFVQLGDKLETIVTERFDSAIGRQ